MKKTIWCLVLGLFVSMAFTGCKDENEGDGVQFEETDLMGKWLKDNTQEYWRFDSGHYGETWDESEDVQEGEGTRFSWELDDETLQVLLTGEMGEVVPYDYTVLALTPDAMKLEYYDSEMTFHKI